MTSEDPIFVVVGKVASTYGVRGWLKIQTYTELGASILNFSPWYFRSHDQQWENAKLEAAKMHGKGVIAKFTGIDSPEAARYLTGKDIAVSREVLPPLNQDEFYWSDLVGLTVLNKNGEILGKVIYLMATGANDVLVIKGEKEHAIPYLPEKVVLKVDLIEKEIHVDWELI